MVMANLIVCLVDFGSLNSQKFLGIVLVPFLVLWIGNHNSVIFIHRNYPKWEFSF